MKAQILETNKLLPESLNGYREQMSKNNLETYEQFSKESAEYVEKITYDLKESTSRILYGNSLKLLDKVNERTEIFVKKYNIDLN